MNNSKFHIDKRPLVKVKCHSPLMDDVNGLGSIPCPDFNEDGQVNESDLSVILNNFGSSLYDLDGDGLVGSSDVSMLLKSWGQYLCASNESDLESVCSDVVRMKRGLSDEILGPNGFYNFIYNRLEKLYQAGFRRIVLQCPSGLLTKNILSVNVVDSFDVRNIYHYKIYENNILSYGSCPRAVSNFDQSNAIDGSLFKGFGSRIKSWLDSKIDNVEIYIEFEAKVPMINGIDFESKNLSPTWNSEGFSLDNFDPNNTSHKEWFIYNTVPWSQYGIKGVVLNNLDTTSMISFDQYDNISEFSWKNSGQKIMCNNIPLYNGSFYSINEYSKCPYIIEFNNRNFNFGFGSNLNNTINNNNEIHLLITHSLTDVGQDFLNSVENGAIASGFIPGFSVSYGENIDVAKLSLQYNAIIHALEKHEKANRSTLDNRVFVLHSEYAGNTTDRFGSVSNLSSAYKRSVDAASNSNIVPVIKVNCSKKLRNLNSDIIKTWCPSWWFSNNKSLCIDSTMNNYVVNSWTIENSSNILKVNTPSPYNTLGPEKCADAAFDLCLQYSAEYSDLIDFSLNKNVVIKLENWGDMYDHDPVDSETVDSLVQGWCSLFTNYQDIVYKVNYNGEEFIPANKFKNLFASNGVVQCSKWMKRFLQRWKFRQQNRRCSIVSSQIADPGLIYIDGQKVFDVADFVGTMSNGHGTFINHLLDPRANDNSVGFNWRNFQNLSDAYGSVDEGQYASEFSVLRTYADRSGSQGSIFVSNAILKSSPYLEQDNAAIEKFIRILIKEVCLRRVYECFGSLIEKEFILGRYGFNEYSVGVPSSSIYAKIQAPFYQYVNRWQHYPNLIGFNQGKSCSFDLCHINPSSVISRLYTGLGWPIFKLEKIRYEVLDYNYFSGAETIFDGTWGWPEYYNQDPSGRGIYISGSMFDASTAGPSHAMMVSEIMKQNHVNYIKNIAASIRDFNINVDFSNKNTILFSHGINNSESNVKLADPTSPLGDFGIGSFAISDVSAVAGYSFNKLNYYDAFKSFIELDSIPDYIIHNHVNHSIQDWNDISLTIRDLNNVSSNNVISSFGVRSPDYDGDGVVGPADLTVLLGSWGRPEGDLDGDGIVGPMDLTIFLGAWGVLASSSTSAPPGSSSTSVPPSSSSTSVPPSSSGSSGILGDLNGDGVVDARDLSILLGDWGGSTYDLNGDGIVSANDLAILLGAWGVLGGNQSSSTSSSSASAPRVDVIRIRIDPSLNSAFSNANGWRMYVTPFGSNPLLFGQTVNSSGSDLNVLFVIQLADKTNYDVAKEISRVAGIYADVIDGAELGDASFLGVTSTGILSINDGIGVLNNLQSSANFVGFENPFKIISLEKTVNDVSLIGATSVSQNYGGFVSEVSISPYAILNSTISNTSTYFTVIDPGNLLSTFKYVSIEGEIIEIIKWSSGRAEISGRGLFGTKKTFHAPNSGVFGLSSKSLFDENFFLDSSNDSKYVYQNRCIVLRNIYNGTSVSNLSVSLNDNYKNASSYIYVGVEVPKHKAKIFTGDLGAGTQTVPFANQNLLQLRNFSGLGLPAFVGSCMKFTKDSSSSPQYRYISSIEEDYLILNQSLPYPVGSYSKVELLPAPSSFSHYGKSDPVASPLFSGFKQIDFNNDFTIPVNMIDTAKSIPYNNIIYIWLKRKVYRDSRVRSLSSLPISINFNILQ